MFHGSAHLWDCLAVNKANAIKKLISLGLSLTSLDVILRLFLKVGFSSRLFPTLLPPGKEHSSAEDNLGCRCMAVSWSDAGTSEYVNMNAPRGGHLLSPELDTSTWSFILAVMQTSRSCKPLHENGWLIVTDP